MYSNVLGRFTGITGEITFDKDRVEESYVKAEIDANTADAARDTSEVRTEFLKSDRFPKITFVSTGVEKTGDHIGQSDRRSDPRWRDKVSHDGRNVQWRSSLHVSGISTVGFSAKGTLSAPDFNINGLMNLKLGPSVDFTIEVQAVKE